MTPDAMEQCAALALRYGWAPRDVFDLTWREVCWWSVQALKLGKG